MVIPEWILLCKKHVKTFYSLHYEKFQDGTVKCIEDEIPFELPEGWSWCRLLSISEVITKGASPKWQGVNYQAHGTLFVTSENVYSEQLLLNTPKYVSPEINRIQSRSMLKQHDILTNIVGASIGRTCEYNLDEEANTNQAVAIIRMINLNVVPYVLKLMNSDYIISLMLRDQVNVARANLSLSSLGSFLIPLPPLREQEKIAIRLSDILSQCELIDVNKTDISGLVDLAKSKILDLAIRGKLIPQDPNDEPASVLLERIRTEKEGLIKQGKIKRDKKESVIFKGEDNSYYEKMPDGKLRGLDDELPFDLPEGWEWCNLSMVGTTNIGLTYRPSDVDPDGVIVLRSCNIVNDQIDLSDLVRVNTTIRENQYAQKNDILICARNGSKALVGKCALISDLGEPALFGAFMAIYRTECYEYIVHFLRSNYFRSVFDDSNSTAINQLTQDMLKRAIVPLPPLAEQYRIAETIKVVMTELSLIEKGLN